MKRAEFLRKTGLAAVGMCGIGLSLALEGCSGVYVKNLVKGNAVMIALEDMEKSEKDYVLVRNDRFDGPVFVQKQEGEWVALLLVCTHARCDVKPAGDRFICPCHNSEFALDGRAIVGPAEENLYQYQIVEKDGFLWINLG